LGKTYGLQTERLTLNLEPAMRARAERSGVRVLNRTNLPPGRYQLRVAAHDPSRNVVGSIVYDLEVPDFDRLPFSMSRPLLMSKSGSRLVTARVDEQTKAVLPAPPVATRTFPQNDELAVFAEVYDRAPAHTVDIVTTVRSEAGSLVFEQAQQRESSELQGGQGAHRYTMRIPLARLEPGAYVISVEARSRLNEALTASHHVRFNVTPPIDPAR
jgi:hypothetical protein